MSLLSSAREAKHAAYLRVQDLRTIREARARRTTSAGLRTRVDEALEIPVLPRERGSIWAIAMVRDEADVLEQTLRQLAEQGVDRMLVMDNGSTDGTRDLLADLARDLPLIVGEDRMAAYEQEVKMTALADHATAAGARWIVPFDADELWMGTDATLAQTLRCARRPIIAADMINVFPDPHAEVTWHLDPTAQRDPKIAFRPFPQAVLLMGNHGVLRPGRSEGGLGIVHRPWRSFEQFARKVRQDAEALAHADLASNYGNHWRHLGALDDATLRSRWEDLLTGRADASVAWRPQAPLVRIGAIDSLTWDDVRTARKGHA